MTEKRGRGQPTKYTEAIAEEICNRISEGETLRAICRDKGMPWRTVFDWLKAHPDFAERYQAARDLGMDAIAEDILHIADTPMVGKVKTYRGSDLVEAKEEDMLGHRKLQIETRLKLLAKWNPKKYGDRVTHTGDPDAPVQLVLNGSDVHG